METLFTFRVETPIGPLRIVSSEKGLVYIELAHANGRGFAGWQKTHAPDAQVIERRTACDGTIEQLLAYASGERRIFEIALDLRARLFLRCLFLHSVQYAPGRRSDGQSHAGYRCRGRKDRL